MRKLALMVVLGVAAMATLGVSSASANTASASCDGGSCTPASTWFTANVTLTWTFDPDPPTDKDSGCDTPQTISAEGDNTITCNATWDPLDPPPTFTPFTVHVKIDKTDPTVTGANASTSPNVNGWFNAPVTFQFTGTDALSGLASCQSVGYSGPDDETANVNGTCTDVAGNTSVSTPHGFKYDNTNPTVTGGGPTRAADHGTWWNHSVTVQLTGSDATSHIDSCTSPTYSGPDDATANASGSCTDNAGNTGTGSSSTFKFDSSPPSFTGGSPTRAPDNGTWYNHAVTVQLTGTDSVSDIESCDAPSYSGPDTAAATVSGSCTNNAGLSASGNSSSFKYDDTPPTGVSGSPNRSADHAGWYNHLPLTIHFAGTDATSGLDSCSDVAYGGADTSGTTVNGSCTDNAGNSQSATSSSFKFDDTAPTAGVAASRPADHAGWYTAPVTLHWSGTDATSGIESCSADNVFSTQTTSQLVGGSCSDNAGNSTTASTTLKYDSVAPAVSVTPSRAPDSGVWYRSPVTFDWSATDATSGPDNSTCTHIINFSTQQTAQPVSGSCSDNAGNSASAPITVSYDSVAPTTTVAPDRTPDHGIWYVRPVTFHTSATDDRSGVNAASCTADSVFSTQTASQVVNGSCSDNAGNSDSGSATVHYDSVTPSVSVSASRPADHGIWYTSPVTFHWTGSDVAPGSGIDSCSADNVFSTQGASRVVSGSCTDNAGLKGTATRSVNYDSVAPTGVTGAPDRAPDAGGWYNHPLNVVFTGTDSVSGIASCSSVPFSTDTPSSGTTVNGTCTDNAGNASASTPSQNIKYDSTPPVNNGGTLDRATPDKDGWYNHALPIHFSGTFGGPSGPGGTCDTVNYTGPDGAGVKGSGNCTSVSGVSAAAQSPAFNFDATPPAVSVTADRPPDRNGFYTHPVTFTVHGADGASGVTSCGGGGTYAGPDTAFGGIVGGCADLAGNTGFGSAGFKYDATPPGSPTVAALPGKRQVKVSWTIPRDASSVVVTRFEQGAAAAPQVIYSGNHTSLVDKKLKDGTKYRYTVSALDAAGNAAAQSIVAVPTTSSLRPFAETAVTGPPKLIWKKVKPARYYNVQLWRDGAKVLSTWPRKPFYQIRPNWTFGGSQYTFSAGHYKWYVWPGFGPLSKHRYGHLIGRSSFSFGVPL